MASYATEMHASSGCEASHNKQSQNSSDSYGNKKTSSTHSTNNYKSSFERTNHPPISQSVPSCSDMNPVTSQLQQQHSQYRYSDPYSFLRQPESNPRTLPNSDAMNCVPSIYTSLEYNLNSPDLCTQTSYLQSYLHRVSCCSPQCPQCLSYNLFAQSYNFPNNGTALQPPLVLSPTMLNNYSTSALCCPSASQIPYYFWYNQDPEYQKQYYQTQLAMSKLNLDHSSPNTCMMVQSGPDSMHGSLPNQAEANYSTNPNTFASVSLSENPNTIVHPPSLIMPMPRSVAIANSPTTSTMNSSNVSSKTNDPSLINQFDYSNASSYASSNSTPLNNQLNGYTTLPMDGVYDPTNSAWYPGYWNSNNLWVSTATGQGGYLTTPFNNNRLSLPISSFSPNPQSFNTDEYAVLHQQYVNTINNDFTGVVNTGNNHHRHHHSTDLITNYNQSRDRTVVVSQQSQQTLLANSNNNNTTSSMPSLSSSSSIMLNAASLSSTPVSKLLSSSSSNQKEYHTLSYYTNPKSNDSLTNLQNVQYCSYPLPFYNTNNVVNMINSSYNNNHTTASVITHNNTNNNNNSSNNNSSNNSNNMRLILTILANSRANTTAVATPNIVHSPYRYSPDRNSLLCNRQKLLSVNPISCNTNTTRSMCKAFSQSELARLNLNVNPVNFDASLVHRARYFIIKSDYVYNVHQSIKYGVWCSTRTGNQCLDEAYQSVHGSTVTITTTTTATTTAAKNVNSRNDDNNNNDNTNIITDESKLVHNSKLQSDSNEKVTRITSTTTTTTTNNNNNNNNNNKSYPTNNPVQCPNDSLAVVTTAPILSVCSTTCTITTNTNTPNNNVNFDKANVSRTKVNTNDPSIPITTISSTIPTANNGQNSTKSKRTSTSTFNTNINSSPGHIILFFSVRESGYLTGVAEMISPVNPQKRSTIWQDLRFRGEFAVRWLYIKHIPNHVIKHILVECYDNRPVTVLRDTSEILPPSKGEELLRIVHEYGLSTSSSLPNMSSSLSTSSSSFHPIGGAKSSTSKIGNNHNFSTNTNLTNSNGLSNHRTTNTSSTFIVPSSTIFNNNNNTTNNSNSKNIVPSASICSTIPENSQVTTNVSNKHKNNSSSTII